MLEKFYPKKYIDSVYQFPFHDFYKRGIKGVIFDIDNTLVPHGSPADEKAVALFQMLKDLGMETCLLSNNKELRVSSFAGQVDSRYIYKAGKPSVKNYEKAMEWIGTDRKTTIFVGDQLFTDVYGANRAGVYSVLVKPIDPREEIQIILKRRLEAVVLHFYKLSRIKREQ